MYTFLTETKGNLNVSPLTLSTPKCKLEDEGTFDNFISGEFKSFFPKYLQKNLHAHNLIALPNLMVSNVIQIASLNFFKTVFLKLCAAAH